jgi:hypothetical protein
MFEDDTIPDKAGNGWKTIMYSVGRTLDPNSGVSPVGGMAKSVIDVSADVIYQVVVSVFVGLTRISFISCS